ncbi:bifunctional diaminohydroxyphosphoribosylaminopyrimidine deaminase/5-amino-6-(5-phosphoribosylamino)uracil reductase RibD [Indiicoccus explosivorum]|uniref:bifunctional diaminohydroxyphosphoribosylaminopyrimidine deaminase/5-amino-6-(5-phosphoribosylamino)uracil reductase RibD n=1 Tax=Indiicoccus explosivorum TaxID=1917864 RepID=UPI000B43B8C9|nr:bifunctional diaminohydroxyphosphoribosylaminopyrimidine deaminase/5-amino-6-(5-phosphoribosylamino)uracil reductase RibD [Indiicoccus explosivorum]
MEFAIRLASEMAGQTSPNPLVGAVCVKDHKIIGMGAHLEAGKPHAEVHALNMAGEAAEGSDLYVTLEPCSHYGKTPPCALKIIDSGVKRVYIATLDPNTLVAGKGVKLLEDAGIEVHTGLLEHEAARMNEAFFHSIIHKTPYVTLKAAATLDGRMATEAGSSKWITSAEAREDVHRLRHSQDAILVGVNTVLHDHPFLTTRLPHGGKNPIRVVLDRRLLTPADTPVTQDASAKTLIYCLEDAREAAYAPHVEVVRLGKRDFLREVLKDLYRRGIMTLLVEGGPRVHASFLELGLVQALWLYQAPKLIGNGPSLFDSAVRSDMADSLDLTIRDVERFGPDVRIRAVFGERE